MRCLNSVSVGLILLLSVVRPALAEHDRTNLSLPDRRTLPSATVASASLTKAGGPNAAPASVETAPAPPNETEGDSTRERQKPKASLQAARAFYASEDFKMSSVP